MDIKDDVIRKYARELEKIEADGTSAGYLTYSGLLAEFAREFTEAPLSLNAHVTVPVLPAGYRWATSGEAMRRTHPAYFGRMVQVKVACTAATALAIKEQ